ncbi:MAG: 4Fe-4S binding protein [Bacteroidaceae bacterium]|nr:4Fe-4S binding protein [Bacteroidaceae bacterium]
MVRKVVVTFPAGSAGRSLTYELIKKFDIMFSIIKADIDAGRRGKLVLELDADEDRIRKAIKYMEESGVEVSPLESKIKYDSTLCISCGACTSSCLSGALSIKAPDWKLVFQPDKCILCKLCLTACPLRLFSTEFAD